MGYSRDDGREDAHVLHVDLVLALDASVLLDGADDLDRRLLRDVVGLRERLGRDVALEDDALDDAGAVAHLEEVELAARSPVVEPPAEGHRLADVLRKLLDPHFAHGRDSKTSRA